MVHNTNMGSGKKRQRTLFSGPGAVKVRLVDKANHTHFIPLDNETIELITETTYGVVPHQCPNCQKSFSNAQGLGGHVKQ